MKLGICTAVLFAALAGCAPTSGYTKCEQVCEAANACKLDQRPVDIDCPEFCGGARRINAAANCGAELEAHLNCWQGARANICDPMFTGCKESGDAWVACLTPFCRGNMTEPACSSGRPALRPF